VDHTARKLKKRIQRKRRIRKKIHGTIQCPRMSVFRSLKHFYVQLIDDDSGNSLIGISTSSKEFRAQMNRGSNIEAAKKIGAMVAEKALEKNITKVVFDRNGRIYHGRVKALAEAAREKGLQF